MNRKPWTLGWSGLFCTAYLSAIVSALGQGPGTVASPTPLTPSSGAAVSPVSPALKPKIQFATPVYDFGRVSSGEAVKFTFFFTNAGNALLVVTNVQPACGCTYAGDWTHEVEPGKTGTIPIQFNSASFGGAVAKMITVVCNDPDQSTVYLQVKGTIWKPIEINPPYAILNVTPDSVGAFTTITITNNMEQLLEVWDVKSTNPAFFPELLTNNPGKAYQLVVNLKGELKPGSIQGSLTARTSATNMQTLAITAWANVQPPISLLPPAINLPQAPLASQMTPIVTIINNTTNPLVLSEAAVNVPGVTVKVNEVQPGRYFSAVLTFPQGFELPNPTPVEFKVKSNNPRYPELTVPVHQAPRPVPAPPASIAAPPVSPLPQRTMGQPAPTAVKQVLPRNFSAAPPAFPTPPPPLKAPEPQSR